MVVNVDAAEWNPVKDNIQNGILFESGIEKNWTVLQVSVGSNRLMRSSQPSTSPGLA